MKTIVIPSDFSLESIQLAETIVRNTKGQMRLVFIHMFHVADDIQDLLFSTYRKKEYDFVSDAFRKECKMLKDLYADKLHSFNIEFFYGNRLAPFKNFLDYYETDSIAYSSSYGVPKISKSSLDAVAIIKKAGYPIIDVDTIKQPALSDVQQS